jgi:hypothetical protein
MSNQTLGVSSKPLKTQPASKAMTDRRLFSELVAGETLPRTTDEQEKASLVQCVQVKMFTENLLEGVMFPQPTNSMSRHPQHI